MAVPSLALTRHPGKGEQRADDRTDPAVEEIHHRVLVGQVHPVRTQAQGPVFEQLPGAPAGDRDARTGQGRLPAIVDARRKERAGHAADNRGVGDMDEIVDVRLVIQAEGVAAGIEQQRDGDGEVERARVAATVGEQAPGDRDDEQRTDVAERPRPDRLAP